MSFLTASDDTMTFDLWPEPMKKEVRRMQGNDQFDSWELFPYSLQTLAKWADVYQDRARPDKSRDRILIYKNLLDAKPGEVYPVAIHLQGLLRQFHIDRFGNWSGHESEVTRAVQYVNISSGGHSDAWQATIRALNLACDYVSRRLHLTMQEIPNYKSAHLLKKRELTMREQRDKPQKCKEAVLTEAQDPEGKYKHVQDLWNVACPLMTANLTGSGKILPMDSVLLSEGDFVDVGAELDFVIMTKTKNDSPPDHDNNVDTRPHKRTRLSNAGDVENDVATSKDVATNQNTDKTNEADVTSIVRETGTAESSTTTTKRGTGTSQPTQTVRSVLPNPTKCLMEDTEVSEYDDALIDRLRKLSEYTNSTANVYVLGKLLPTATWGQYKPVNDRSKILCNPANGEPLTIWVVGKISKMWFTKFGNPERQASITIMPLSKTLAQQSALLVAKMSSPALSVNQQATQVIRAIKWQYAKNSDAGSEAMLFDSVYDARAEGSLKTYSERLLWNLADLKPGDLILLEMKMTKYSKKQEDKWHSRAQYEMIAISLLDVGEMPEEDTQVTQDDHGIPTFHVDTAADLLTGMASAPQIPETCTVSCLSADLINRPIELENTIESVANDITVYATFCESVKVISTIVLHVLIGLLKTNIQQTYVLVVMKDPYREEYGPFQGSQKAHMK
ncbi:hypothetical protein DEU56DRAFT_754129 [Suillus clintonianus]|uniref:uncharacterized protein n=1 Tax=Suillus clintonianus TaxID=1904413 RepID=UPI001B86B155|nr:uncharacterized protein DEU56DRAFT_754129 [Suillus clintonianus]KAG2145273.1 hypothetical protein DEU56DRAFT_754129 [Suillus clintonianus]